MKVSVDKSRFGIFLLSIGIVVILTSLLILLFTRPITKSAIIKIKLHAVPNVPVAMKSITPTASPTASLKFNPAKGVIE
jgi:hypothetical protein